MAYKWTVISFERKTYFKGTLRRRFQVKDRYGRKGVA